MRILITSFIAFTFLLLQACTANESQATTETPVAEATPVAELQPDVNKKVLPQFTVLDASGKSVDLQSFKGKKVFVNLWATWCPPCRAEMPSIEKLYSAANKENAAFVMLSLDNDFETAKKYVQEKDLNLPIYYPAGDLPDLFAVNGIPTTFIFNEEGELVEQREGSDDYNTAAYRKLFGAVN